jgi:peptide/nickel transport system permease protein
MKRFLIRKIIFLPLTFIGITAILFFIINTLPPQTLASAYSNSEKELTSEELNTIIEKYDLKGNIIKRYLKWLSKIIKGDLGYSQTSKMSVSDSIKKYLPATIELALFSIIPIFLIGNYLGLKAAREKDTLFDKIISFTSSFLYSIPSFIIGIILLFLFYGILGIFTPARYSIETEILISSGFFKQYTGFMIIDSILNLNFRVLFDSIKHLILPSFSIFLGTSATFIKITRNSTIEEMGKDYVRTLRAKGLDEDYIFKKHIRRNILIPQITVGGLQMIRLLSGVVITEAIFDWPGIGSFGVKAARQLDISGVMGFVIVVSALFIIGNLIIDLLYAYFDPRIKYE